MFFTKTILRANYFGLLLAFCLSVLAIAANEFKPLQDWNQIIGLNFFSRPASEDIVIVTIDEHSLKQLGKWPWPRNIHVEFINRLTKAGIKAAALDMHSLDVVPAPPWIDNKLAQAIRRNDRIVLPVFLVQTSSADDLLLHLPLPELALAAAQLGHVNIDVDIAGIAQGIYTEAGNASVYIPALPLALHEVGKMGWQQKVQNNDAIHQGKYVQLNDYKIIMSYTDYVESHFIKISYADVLSDDNVLNFLRGKYVLVGMTALGLGQRYAIPAAKNTNLMTEVELSANVLNAALSGLLLQPLKSFWNIILTFLLVFSPVAVFCRLSPRQALLLTLLFVVITCAICVLLVEVFAVWYGPLSVLLTLLMSYPLWSWHRQELVTQSLFKEKEKANATLQAIGDAVVSTNANGIIEYMNPVAENMAGCSLQQARGQNLDMIFTLKDDETLNNFFAITRYLKNGGVFKRKTPHFLLNQNNREFAIRLAANPISGVSGDLAGMVFAFTDITEIVGISQRMTFLANHDFLTKLPNRVLLQDRLNKAIDNAHRFNTQIAVLFIDLDGFKKINDGMGHVTGDLLLKEVAMRLRSTKRQSDTAARWGGDEFVLLLPSLTHEEVVIEIANKILSKLSRSYFLEGQELFITPSIGISIYPKDGLTADMLLTRADAAMYRVKDAGRNNFCFYSQGLNDLAKERLELEKEMHHAILEEDFEVYYQPFIDLKLNRIVGVEALLRWHHHEKGVLLPDEFLPLAEEVGLIIPIGQWLIHTVCNQLHTWQRANLPDIYAAINLSPRQVMQKDLVDSIARALKNRQIGSHCFQIEITEQTMIKDVDRIADVLQEFKSLGISVAIDDFGMGYSSLNFLKRFPIDMLKIDKSFIADVFTNPDDASIVQSVISLGHNMHMKIIAEGIETQAHLHFLKERNCDLGQGFYFSPPLEADEMTKVLQNGLQSERHANISEYKST
jgi:diguanylate cyclase (GGDEF)-like protein/PAS domain S-box-containing protein